MISVIMGVYNEVDSILTALDSLKHQTIKDIELVVCDDCSTDGSWELLQTIKDEYRINVLLRNEVNCGLAYSLNRCIKHSSGEYIARMDADDWCISERLEKQLTFLIKHTEFDLVGTQCILVDNYGNKYQFNKPETPNMDILPLTNPFIHPTIMARRYVFELLGGYTVSKRTKCCEDLELWYRFFELNLKGYNIQEYLYYKNRNKKKRKIDRIKIGFDIFFVNIYGMKKLDMKWYKYFFAIKPILTALIPQKIMWLYRKCVFRKI